jgi:hypothetical protein
MWLRYRYLPSTRRYVPVYEYCSKEPRPRSSPMFPAERHGSRLHQLFPGVRVPVPARPEHMSRGNMTSFVRDALWALLYSLICVTVKHIRYACTCSSSKMIKKSTPPKIWIMAFDLNQVPHCCIQLVAHCNMWRSKSLCCINFSHFTAYFVTELVQRWLSQASSQA